MEDEFHLHPRLGQRSVAVCLIVVAVILAVSVPDIPYPANPAHQARVGERVTRIVLRFLMRTSSNRIEQSHLDW
jgi:hypothetical protein